MSFKTYIEYLKQKIETVRFVTKRKQISQKLGDNTIKKETSFLMRDIIAKFWKKWATGLSIFIALSAGLAESTGYNLKSMFFEETRDTFSITVLVHGERGKSHLMIRNQGSVILDVGDIREEAPIDYKGVAVFDGIPSLYKGRKAYLCVDHPQVYRPIDTEGKYPLTEGQSIYLGVTRDTYKDTNEYLVDF